MKILKIALNGAGAYEYVGLCAYTPSPPGSQIMHFFYSSPQLSKL